MKVALICHAAEQIGLQYISAGLKRHGHQTRLFLDPSLFNDRVVFNFEFIERHVSMRERLIRAVADWSPDLIGISVVTINYQWARQVCRELKKQLPMAPIIAGGPHAMLVPEVFIGEPCFDMVCTGEGEKAMVELADSLASGTTDAAIRDIWFKVDGQVIRNPLRNLHEDLDSLPFPDRSIFEPFFSMSDSLLTMSQRGCIFRCAYCSHNVLRDKYRGKGTYVRRKSPERFIEELRYFKKKYDYKFVRIYDDIFTHDQKWLESFAPLYGRHIGKPFFCLGHPRYLKEDAVRLIKEAGCRWIQVGIESLNQGTRAQALNRPETNEEISRSIGVLEKYKLRYELDFIFGLPGDDICTYEDTVDFLKKMKHLNRVSALSLSYLPKTEIIDRSMQCQDISEDDLMKIEQGLEGCQTDRGSIRDIHKRRLAEQYNLLYRLCAFLSESQIDLIRRTGLHKVLVHLNPVLLYLVRLLGMDTVDRIFLKLFFRQLGRVVFHRDQYYADTADRI